jgi:transposase
LYEICLSSVTCVVSGRFGRRIAARGQFGENALHQLRLQLWKLAVKDLRDRALDDLLELLAIRHS